MTNFFRTVSTFKQNNFINPYSATVRHLGWAIRRVLNWFPYDIHLGSLSVRIANRSVARGVGALINAMGYYDPNNMYFIEELFRRGTFSRFLDVGSNIGIYSLIAASASNSVEVAAFEPHPATFTLLEENVRLNRLEAAISCFRIALGDSNSNLMFQNAPGNPENRVLETIGDTANAIQVTGRRGDEFCLEHRIVPEVIKLDVEGFENRVLAGFERLLKDVQLIFVECWDLPQTVEILVKRAGFLGPYKLDYLQRSLVKEDSNYEDWIFVNPNAVDLLRKTMSIQIDAN